MATLPQLSNPETYVPCEWDLKRDAAGRTWWVEHFIQHLEPLTENIYRTYPETDESAVAGFRNAYVKAFRRVNDCAEEYPRIDIYTLDQLRIEVQDRFGFRDPYRAMKTADNQRAMSTLPEVLKELDQITTADRQRLLVQGLMAGNLCDAGSMVAMDRHASLEGDFRRVRGEQSSIRWWRDDAAAWFAAWHAQPRKHVAAFVDNSGSDICLGVLPFVCWILRHGTNVTLVANEGPALNDITCGELRGVVKGLDALRHRTAETWGRLEIVSNSQACPLVDLGRLSAECVAHVADSDLIWLHGMGRAVESNWTAGFSCDVLRTAVLKEAAVASRVGGGLLDCVFRFDRAG